ncbi:MAG: Rpn family recombination-promoting nuclease/putative transposase [Planctomycetota bacterium]
MSPHRTPHDRLFQFLFAHARHALDCVRTARPADVAAAIDWTTFARAGDDVVGPALRVHRADAVFAARTRAGGRDVLLLVEHKAWADAATEEQLLRYAVHLRRRAQHRGRQPPLLVALVVQHGTPAARTPAAPAAPAADDPFAAGQPRLPFAIDDLSGASEDGLRARGLTPLATLALLCLALPPTTDRTATLAALARWGDLLRALDADDGPPPPDDALATICWYLADTTELTKDEIDMTVARKVVLDIAYPGTGGEKLRQQWFAEGRLEGRLEGKAEGRDEGRCEGVAAVLLRHLTRRFGPVPADVQARIRSAPMARLEAWCDRVLDARDLAAVFAD